MNGIIVIKAQAIINRKLDEVKLLIKQEHAKGSRSNEKLLFNLYDYQADLERELASIGGIQN